MGEALAASVPTVLAAALGLAPTPTPTPAAPVDAAPVLTSEPFGALPGQRVTHTVTIAGTAALVATRVTFTTTADLDGISARARPGWCDVAARTVVCDLGDLRLASGAPAPRITITGRVRPGSAPGTLVRNLVSLTSAEVPEDQAHMASNAYLVPDPTATLTDPPVDAEVVATPAPATSRSKGLPVALATAAAAGIVAAASVVTRRRMRRRRAVPAGRADPM